MNKKAIATSVIIDVWGLIVYFLIFLIVYISIIATSKLDYNVCVEQIKESSTMNLLNTLKTPIDFNSKTITIAEYLSVYAADNSISTDKIRDDIQKQIENSNIDLDFYCLSFVFDKRDEIALSKYSPVSSCEKIDNGEKISEVKFPGKDSSMITASSYVNKLIDVSAKC